jgi:multiple sugar transport system substrate-binding protein
MFSSDRISRRRLLGAGGEVAPVAAVAGVAPEFIRPGRAYAADSLAPGMVGGPTGFEGFERHQDGEDTLAGRAIEGTRALEADVPRSKTFLDDSFMANRL